MKELKEAYAMKKIARENLAEATWEKYSAEMNLKSRESELLVSGSVAGTNDKARAAHLREATIDERMIVGDCTLRHIMVDRDYDIASDVVRLQRELLDLVDAEIEVLI